MNSIEYTLRYCFALIFFSMICWLCFSVDVWAVETTGGFRHKYDIAMRWVNFIIMVIIFFKYGYRPLLNFMQAQRVDIEKRIDDLEEKRRLVTNELENAIKSNKESEVQLKKLRRRIISEGEKKYQSIIEQAQQQSRVMLEDTKRKNEVQIVEARNAVKNEIIDVAMKLAKEKLKILTGGSNGSNYDNSVIGSYADNITSRSSRKKR